MLKITDFRGKVSKCSCTNSNPATPMSCNRCFSRGFLAECLRCMASGQIEEPVAGGNGTMKSTCAVCGGSGHLGVPKPEDWDALHPVAAEVEAAPAGEGTLAAALDQTYDTADQIPPGDPGWVSPPLRSAAV